MTDTIAIVAEDPVAMSGRTRIRMLRLLVLGLLAAWLVSNLFGEPARAGSCGGTPLMVSEVVLPDLGAAA